MKKENRIFITPLIVLGFLLLIITSGCEKDKAVEQKQVPILTTNTVENITQTTATCGGNISSDGESAVISRGVCWGTEANPTISDNKTTDSTGTGVFESLLLNLNMNTKYYVRAYATNIAGTAYGNEISFKTNNEIIPQYNILKVVDGKEIRNIISTSDGGYAGIAHSDDYNVIKFDSEFSVIWEKTYGGSKGDYVQSIIQTNEGGYLVSGGTLSSDGDVSSNYGSHDIWLCKLDANGNIVWKKNYGGTGDENVGKENTLMQTNDGGFIFIGYTTSSDNDISVNNGSADIWVVKISSTGSIESERTFGGSKEDYGRNLVKTNSGYAFLAKVNSTNGDFNEVGSWIVQLDESFNILWKTNLKGVNTGFLNTTNDGGFVVANPSFTDFSLNKLSSDGNVKLSKTISFQAESKKQPGVRKVLQTADGGYLIIGELGNGNDADALLFRVGPDFSLLYKQIYNGNSFDMSATLIPISANKYIYQFMTNSKDIPDVNYLLWEASVIMTLEEN